MNQENRELLLKDLCARLRSGVIVKAQYKDGEGWKTEDRKLLGIYEDGKVYIDCAYTNVENVKPYLRPMSSMTEEEKCQFRKFVDWTYDCNWKANSIEGLLNRNRIISQYAIELFDWLNAHHFDYHGLIEKGLALEAPEDMYKINTK